MTPQEYQIQEKIIELRKQLLKSYDKKDFDYCDKIWEEIEYLVVLKHLKRLFYRNLRVKKSSIQYYINKFEQLKKER